MKLDGVVWYGSASVGSWSCSLCLRNGYYWSGWLRGLSARDSGRTEGWEGFSDSDLPPKFGTQPAFWWWTQNGRKSLSCLKSFSKQNRRTDLTWNLPSSWKFLHKTSFPSSPTVASRSPLPSAAMPHTCRDPKQKLDKKVEPRQQKTLCWAYFASRHSGIREEAQHLRRANAPPWLRLHAWVNSLSRTPASFQQGSLPDQT